MKTLNDLKTLIESYDRQRTAQDSAVQRFYDSLASIDPDAPLRLPQGSLPDIELPARLSLGKSFAHQPLLRG